MTQSLPRRASGGRSHYTGNSRDGRSEPYGDRRPGERRGDQQPSKAARKGLARLATPQLNYLVIMAVTLILTVIGLTMVLSSSMVTSYAGGSGVFSEFIKQGIVVAIGLVGMRFALQLRPSTIRKLAPWLLVISFLLLIAVLIPGIGVGGEEVGSNSWIRVGPVGIQPSEVAKLALAVWGASVLPLSRRPGNDKYTVPVFMGGTAIILLLVLAQKDLGMMFALVIVVLALFFFSGISTRVIGGSLVFFSVVGLGFTMAHSFRSARFTTWVETFLLDFPEASTKSSSYQSHQGILSLSDGGFLGAGLGQSRAKWFYLPEAKNDFIFAVIGEELGFIGAVIVVILFATLGIFGIRTALAQRDPFMRLLAATLTVGVVVQAFFNMGYVVGFVPMTGVQLPLISAGGSSAIITLVTLGLLANCARHEPEAISSMQHEGRPFIDRLLWLPEPVSHLAGDQRRAERRATTQIYGEPVTRQRPIGGAISQDFAKEQERMDRLRERNRRFGGGARADRYDSARRSRLPERDESSTERRRPTRRSVPRNTPGRRS